MKSGYLGNLVKNIRTAKGLSLKEVSGDKISLSLISKFERGESEISINKFFVLLENMNITFEEFTGLIEKDYPSRVNKLIKNASKSYFENNILALEKYKKNEIEKYNKSNNKNFLFNSFLFKSFILKFKEGYFEENEIRELTDYLFGVENWGKYELFIFGNTLQAIDIRTLDLLANELIYKTTFFGNEEENYLYKIQLLINISERFIFSNEIHLCQKYLNILKNMPIADKYLYEKMSIKIVEGYYFIKNGCLEKGKEQIENALKALELIGADNLYLNLENEYKRFLDFQI